MVPESVVVLDAHRSSIVGLLQQWNEMQRCSIQTYVLLWIVGPTGAGKSCAALTFAMALDRSQWDVLWVHHDRHRKHFNYLASRKRETDLRLQERGPGFVSERDLGFDFDQQQDYSRSGSIRPVVPGGKSNSSPVQAVVAEARIHASPGVRLLHDQYRQTLPCGRLPQETGQRRKRRAAGTCEQDAKWSALSRCSRSRSPNALQLESWLSEEYETRNPA